MRMCIPVFQFFSVSGPTKTVRFSSAADDTVFSEPGEWIWSEAETWRAKVKKVKEALLNNKKIAFYS